MTKAQKDINKKLRVFEYAKAVGNVAKTWRHFGISRDTYYRWQRNYQIHGEDGLVDSKPCPQNVPLRTSSEVEDKIVYLRRVYHLGQQRISWYLERYHAITISPSGVYCVLKRNGLNRLLENTRKRMVKTTRYEKQVPGHHIQVDVKFLNLRNNKGKEIKRFQYTAIDDATRVRALKIYEKHTQENAIAFIDHVVSKFPFRIHTIRTDNGHEFQTRFHWHGEDHGMRHVYIKPGTPRLNGKVERSHLTDDREFYQLLTYTDDVDLLKRLQEWEDFYNLHRPHGSLARDGLDLLDSEERFLSGSPLNIMPHSSPLTACSSTPHSGSYP